jgi:basic membrane lipoprotein Med (substrate-binding protein (PBP1-ABC) superfamily)
MIINGDWSLSGYAGVAGLDFGTAPIPKIVKTGKYPSPMTSGKYYMISADVKPGTPKFEAVKKFVEFMTGEHAQQVWLEKSKVLPSNIKVSQSPLIQSDPILKGSAEQLSKGRGMPAAPHLRCFWDSARPGQQGVLADVKNTPAAAAKKMQEDADRCIKEAGLGAKKQVKVGLVTDVGKVNDGTFNEFAYKGLMKAVDEFKLQNAFIETLAPTDYEKNIEQFAKEGYDVIVTVGFMIGDATAAMAKKYPNIKFAGVDQFYADAPANAAGLIFSEDQSGFLAGCLAGLMTKSNVVGIVAGMEIPPVIKFRTGYENGAQFVNPNVKVLGVYIDSFVDPARGKEAALSQIAEKADVIFGAGGPTGSGGIMGAAAQGVWVIGVDQDEYLTTFGKGSVAGANKLLSSAMKRVDVAVYTAIRNSVIDLWQGGNLLFESKNDGVGLAPYHDTESAIPQAVKDKLTQIAADMKAGKIESGVKL